MRGSADVQDVVAAVFEDDVVHRSVRAVNAGTKVGARVFGDRNDVLVQPISSDSANVSPDFSSVDATTSNGAVAMKEPVPRTKIRV